MPFVANAGKVRNIMKNFLMRDGATETQAVEELNRLFITPNICITLEAYKRIARTGSTLILNRQGRINVWNLLQNAMNHAAFDEELSHAMAGDPIPA